MAASSSLPAVGDAVAATTTATTTTAKRVPDGYPRRTWWRKVPFVSTRPRAVVSDFHHPLPIPEARANPFSLLTFGWLNDVLSAGYTRPLCEDDLYRLQKHRSAAHLADALEDAWKRQCEGADAENARRRGKPSRAAGLKALAARALLPRKLRPAVEERKVARPSLMLAMNAVVWRFFWFGGLMKLLSDVGTITSPLLLRAITDYVQLSYDSRNNTTTAGAAPPGWGRGFGLAIGLFVVQLAVVFLNVHSFYRSFGTGILLRTALIHAVYRRALRLSHRARVTGGLGTAKLVSLISADVSRIDFSCQFFHMGWTSVAQIAVALGLLVSTLGYSALPGFALLFLLSPPQTYITRHLFALRKASMRWTDARVHAVSELLAGIRLVKYMAWEPPYLARIAELRRRELEYLRQRLGWRSANLALGYGAPTIAAVVSFIVYAATGHDLQAGAVFSSLTYFQLLRTPLQFLPIAWNAVAEAYNAAQRIADVFEAEESPPPRPVEAELPNALEIRNADFVWEAPPPQPPPSSTPTTKTAHGGDEKRAGGGGSDGGGAPASPTAVAATPSRLTDVTLTVPRGKLVAVVGPIGSGKSSLLHAVAGEMRQTGGEVRVGASMGMAAQTAWVLSSSVKSNILFGRPYDEERYRSVVRSCCLLPDFEMLPDGDETVVGEKGLSLSGGQRQRVNIARALYHDDDMLLLDDCFSALDAHVGDAVFRQVLLGSARHKTRVLATHSLHLLRHADLVVTLDGGRIVECGTYDELINNRGAFADLIDEFGSSQKVGEGAPEQRADGGKAGHADSDGGGDGKDAASSSDATSETKRDGGGGKGGDTADAKPGRTLMQTEERVTGSVGANTYRGYLGAGNLPVLLPLFCLAILVFQGTTILSPLWLLWWEERRYGLSTGVYMGVYALLGVVQALGLGATGCVFAYFVYFSSAQLHGRALRRVVRAPVSFFDTTPLGRITHRFSKDIDVIDNQIGEAIRIFITVVVSVIGSVILIAYLTPYFLAAVAAVTFLYVWTGMYYRMSARELRRLDAVLRSKVYEHFSESLAGVSVVRAFGETQGFRLSNAERIDTENRAYWLSMACQRWLSIRLDGYGTLLVLAVALLTVGTRFTISPGSTGVALSFILTVQSVWSYVIRQSAEIENNMSGVERIVHYANEVPMEPAHEVPEVDAALPPGWPRRGGIEMRGVVVSHRPELPPVIKGLDLDIRPGEHVGVCGRTGAGKSTLVTTLTRMMELTSGVIRIDGVDISTLGLRTLRSSVSIIPQDPLLFSGTLRYNLDPLNQRTDAELYDALRRACLLQDAEQPQLRSQSSAGRLTAAESETSTSMVPSRVASETTLLASYEADARGGGGGGGGSSSLSLEFEIEEEGRNLSVGQRSLVSLARALARKTRIVMLDEATASVDYSTDAALQRTISHHMANLTVITVAHRLATVIGYDRICLLDAGRVAELGTPLELWDAAGTFRAMCESSGIDRDDIEAAQKERSALRNCGDAAAMR